MLKNNNLVILIHGFSSSDKMMTHLSSYLSKNNIDNKILLLAGHGSDFQSLEESSYQDWLDSAENFVEENLAIYDNIFIIGHSMGANIALHLANKYEKVRAVMSIGFSMFINKHKIIKFFLFWYKLFGIKKWRKIWVEENQIEQIKTLGGHVDLPIKSIDNFFYFIDKVTPNYIREYTKPILIVHSRHDKVSKPYGSQQLFEKIGSKNKQIFILDKTDHSMLHHTRRDFLFGRFVSFINSIA